MCEEVRLAGREEAALSFEWIRAIATTVVPGKARSWLRGKQRQYGLQYPRAGTVQFGELRRLTPISRVFGLDRGMPVDRYYIEQFLSEHSVDISGRVLEIGDDFYTRKFGADRVGKCDVLHVVEGNSKATIVADLTRADNVPSDTFDCIIFTQTLQMIYDARAALHHVYRVLKPGGVLLLTSGSIAKIGRREGRDPWGEYWHFTAQSTERLLREVFPAENVDVKVYGNVLVAIAMLHGLAAEEFERKELDYSDPDFEVLIGVRARKASATREANKEEQRYNKSE
ncbi:MAG: class I SAM-dependent methyltransferase [Gammaproteobacteria bacterium]|nr:class I SAM-dependent methyltransferase [Gammaproteobacteria bacterium]